MESSCQLVATFFFFFFFFFFGLTLPNYRNKSGSAQPPLISTTSAAAASTVIVEGMLPPPLSTKLLDKIPKWDYVDLTLLLDDQCSKPPEDYPVMGNRQIVVIEPDRVQRCRKQISDIFTWLKAFSRYVAALTSGEATTSAQATSLVAHLHLILQLSQKLGPQWQRYNTDFRQWAAARNIRQWGESELYNLWTLLVLPTASLSLTQTTASLLHWKQKSSKPGSLLHWKQKSSKPGSLLHMELQGLL